MQFRDLSLRSVSIHQEKKDREYRQRRPAAAEDSAAGDDSKFRDTGEFRDPCHKKRSRRRECPRKDAGTDLTAGADQCVFRIVPFTAAL